MLPDFMFLYKPDIPARLV